MASSLLEGELWISWAPTVIVREDVGLAFQLPFDAPRRKQWTPQGQRQDQEEEDKTEPRDCGSLFLTPATWGPPCHFSASCQRGSQSPRGRRFPPPGVSCHPISGATRTCSKPFAALTKQTGAVGTSWYFNDGKILAQKFLFIFFLTCMWLFVIVSFHSSSHSLEKLRTLSELMTISVRTRN